jgi:uncharacterized membrane protein
MDWKTAARIAFALTFIGIGVIGLVSGTFAPLWNSVPETAPARSSLAYLSTFVSLACGVGLLAKRTVTPAALVLTIFLIVWTVATKGLYIVRAPLVEGSYQSNGENWVLIAAAWVLYADQVKSRNFLSSDLGVRARTYRFWPVAFLLSRPDRAAGPRLAARPTGVLGLCDRDHLHRVRAGHRCRIRVSTGRAGRRGEHHLDQLSGVGADGRRWRPHTDAFPGNDRVLCADRGVVGAG